MILVLHFLFLNDSELQSTFFGIRQKFGEEREDLCFKLIRLVMQHSFQYAGVPH